MHRFRLIVLALAAAALAACGSARIHMNEEQRASFKSLDVRAIVPQEEVIVSVRPSAAFAGGAAFGVVGVLIGASIDASTVNSRVAESQKMIGDFYLAADDIDFRSMLETKLRATMPQAPYAVSSLEMSPLFPTLPTITATTSTLPPEHGLWLLYSSYELSTDYRQLTTSTVATIWKKGGEQPIHRGILIYQSDPLGSGGADSVTQWSADNATRYRHALDAASDAIARLATLDLGISENRKQLEQMTLPFTSPLGPMNVSGGVLQREASRVVLINEAGIVYSLPLAPAQPQNP